MKKAKLAAAFLLALCGLLISSNGAYPAEKVKSPAIERGGFLSPDAVLNTGIIVKGTDEKTVFNNGDAVFILLNSAGTKIGDRFSIFRVVDEVKHPVTDKKAGYLIDILGVLEVAEIRKDVVIGKISKSYKDISAGDRLKPFEQPATEVEIKKSKNIVHAVILAGAEKRIDSAAGDIVYIDKGKKDGILVGNTFTIFRPRKDASHPVTEKNIPLPEKEIGRAVIIHTEKDTSSALIIQSAESISSGDRVMTAE